ncbi:MAG: hypothetical protein ACOH2N_19815 [Devosia sp.]
MPMTALHSRLARTGIGLGVREAAFLSGVSPETVTRIEKGEAVKSTTIAKVADTYRFLGAIFIDEPERSGLMVDLDRLSAVKSGAHDLEFYEMRNDDPQVQLGALSAFLKVIDGGGKWTAKGWSLSERG